MNNLLNNPIALWLALLWAPNISWPLIENLFTAGYTLTDLFNKKLFEAQLTLPGKLISYLKQPNWEGVEQHLRWADENASHHIITIDDPRYPQLLKQIHTPPLILFIKGDPLVLNTDQIAMVGSRKPTPCGKENAFEIARELTEHGITITSGLAYGIDIQAHLGALATPGKTLAVLGCGLDTIYPRKHHLIADKISEHGAIVSEFTLNSPPLPAHFPQRNRIVTGMSLGTVVVEATLKSGSLISARFACEQNREVFAIPGSIHSNQSEGCHYLLKNGATLLSCVDDIFAEIPSLNHAPPGTQLTKSCEIALEQQDANLLECIGFETTPMDAILVRSQLSITQIAPKLLNLELLGLISTVAGGYTRVV